MHSLTFSLSLTGADAHTRAHAMGEGLFPSRGRRNTSTHTRARTRWGKGFECRQKPLAPAAACTPPPLAAPPVPPAAPPSPRAYRGGFVGGRALRPRWARSGRLRVGVRCRHSLRPQRAGPLAWQAVPCPPPALFRGPAAQPRAVGQARLETPSGVFPGGLQPPATGPPPVHPARPAACMQPAVRAGFSVPLPGRQAPAAGSSSRPHLASYRVLSRRLNSTSSGTFTAHR